MTEHPPPPPEFTALRLNIKKQLSAALDRYQEVIKVIAQAPDRVSARWSLQELLSCDEVTARVVMDTPLEALTGERRARLAAEIEELRGNL